MILLLYLLHYYDGCQYVKGTKQILIAVCVVEFTGSHSIFPVCKLQFYTVNVFTVFLYFLQKIIFRVPTGFGKVWKSMEFDFSIFQVWKSMEKRKQSMEKYLCFQTFAPI